MVLHEILVRERMRNDQSRARQERLARRLTTARRWQRLARYADRRARRATERLQWSCGDATPVSGPKNSGATSWQNRVASAG